MRYKSLAVPGICVEGLHLSLQFLLNRGPGSVRAIFYSKNSATLCLQSVADVRFPSLPGIGPT
jgi:hypothetical protein